MNYRHAYHAGNFADVIKHMVLVYTLHHLRKKETPFYVLDTHAGKGLYDLESTEAQKTQEALAGVLSLDFQSCQNVMVRLYQEAIGPYLEKKLYPGSPLLISQILRPQDRAQVVELHPEDTTALRILMNPYKNVQTYGQDGYQSLRAFLPPKEKRGLVLIDPPFENPEEVTLLLKNLHQARKRFAHGIYLIWYPVKNIAVEEALISEVKNLGAPFLSLRFGKKDKGQDKEQDKGEGLSEAGLLLLNPPFGLEDNVVELGPWFCAQRYTLRLLRAAL